MFFNNNNNNKRLLRHFYNFHCNDMFAFFNLLRLTEKAYPRRPLSYLTMTTWCTGCGTRMSYFSDSHSIHGVQGVEPGCLLSLILT